MTTDYWYFVSMVLRRTWDRLRDQPDLQVVHDRTLDYLTVNRRGTSSPVLVTGAEVISAAGWRVVCSPPPPPDDYVPKTRPWVAPVPRTYTDEMVNEAVQRAVELVFAALDEAEPAAGGSQDADQDDALPTAFPIQPHPYVFADPDLPGVPLVPLPTTADGVACWLRHREWGKTGIGFSSYQGPVALTARLEPVTGALVLTCAAVQVGRPKAREGEPRFGTWTYDKETATAALSVSVSVPAALADRAHDITEALAVDLVLTALAELGFPSPRPSAADHDLDEAAGLIPVMQDGLAMDLLFWDVRHQAAGSTAELHDRTYFEFGVSRSVVLGGGIRLQARVPHPASWAGPDEVASLSSEHPVAIGRWDTAGSGLEYSAFLSQRLLRLVADYPASRQFLSRVVLDVTNALLEVSQS